MIVIFRNKMIVGLWLLKLEYIKIIKIKIVIKGILFVVEKLNMFELIFWEIYNSWK